MLKRLVLPLGVVTCGASQKYVLAPLIMAQGHISVTKRQTSGVGNSNDFIPNVPVPVSPFPFRCEGVLGGVTVRKEVLTQGLRC